MLAVAGWAFAALAWSAHGREAGVLPGFIMALTVAATFSMVLAVTVVMPDKARMYSLGFHDGVRARTEMEGPERPRLELVR